MKKALLATLILTLPMFANAEGEHHPLETVNAPMFGQSRDAIETKLKTHTVSGSAFTKAYADQFVEAIGKVEILKAIDSELATIKGTIEDFEAFKQTATKQLPVLKEFDADMHAYVFRIAELLDIPVEDYWVSMYMDGAWVEGMQPMVSRVWNGNQALLKSAYEDMIQGRGGCTTAAWTNGIIGGNMDFSSLFLGHQQLIQSDDLIFEGTYYGAFRAMGKNIGIVVNTLVTDSTGYGANGLPQQIIIASVAKRAVDVGHARELLASVKAESPFNYTLADKKGNAVAYNMVESDQPVTVEAENGAVVHTNHRTSSREKLLAAWDNDYRVANEHVGYSIARRDLASILLKIVPENERNVESMKTILRTQPILMKAANGLDFGTTNSYVIDLNAGCMYMSPDRPDLVNYEKFCFDDK
ncbi:C45 family autoproteolytic acyltransferase/hydolase [Photobacterium frigidiphilum]|nr:C45 family autoproteolytic acyltransferase/hydolase [Photobacterium frigidiphilum]